MLIGTIRSLTTSERMKENPLKLKMLTAVAFAALVLGAQTPAIGANYFGRTSAGSGTTQVPGPSDNDIYDATAPGSTSSSSAITIVGPTASMDAASSSFAGASPGAAHASAVARARAGNSIPGQASASSSASSSGDFRDVFALNAASFAAGTQVLLTFGVDVHGSFGGDGSIVGGNGPTGGWAVEGFWRATTFVNANNFVQGQSLFRNSNGIVNTTGDGHFGTSLYTVNVLLGLNSVRLLADASASARVATDFSIASTDEAALVSDLGNAVGWGGIVALRTLDGTAITDFSAVSSSSGFDYAHAFSQPVPEPETYAMLLAGLGLLGFSARRRRRQPA